MTKRTVYSVLVIDYGPFLEDIKIRSLNPARHSEGNELRRLWLAHCPPPYASVLSLATITCSRH